MSKEGEVVLDRDPFARILRSFERNVAPPAFDVGRVTYILEIIQIPRVDVDEFVRLRAEEEADVIPVRSLYRVGFHCPFVPKLFESVRISDFPDAERASLVDYVLCNFIAWTCYYDRTRDPSHFQVVMAVLAEAMKFVYSSVTLSAFCYASKLFLRRRDTVFDQQYMTQLVALFSRESVPVDVCFLLVEGMTKLIEDGNSEMVTQMTALVCRTAEENRRLLSSYYASEIVSAMRPLLLGFNPQALACLSFIFPLTESMEHLRLFVELAGSMLKLVERKEEPMPWPKSDEEALLLCPATELRDTFFSFRKEDSFVDGFEIGGNPLDERSTSYVAVLDTEILDVLRLILLSMTRNDCGLSFLHEIFRTIRSSLNSPYLGNYYHFVVLSHRECLSKLPRLELGVEVFHSGIFATNITIFDEPKDFDVMDMLRNAALLNALTEGPDMLVRVMELAIPYPKLFTELCYRLVSLSNLFRNAVRRSTAVVGSIRFTLNVYAELQATVEDDKLKLVENARKALLYVISYLLEDVDIRKQFLADVNFCKSFVAMVFEKSLKEYILGHLQQFLEGAEPQDAIGMVMMISGVLVEASNHLGSPNARSLIIRILEVCTDVEKVNPLASFIGSNKLMSGLLSEEGIDAGSGREIIGKLVDFMTAAGDRLSIKDEEAAMLTNIIKKYYGEKDLASLFDKLVGMVIDIGGDRTIRHGHLLSILFDVFSDSHLFVSLFQLLSEVCTANVRNVKICHQAEVDLLLIDMIWKLSQNDETEKMAIVLRLLEQIATHVSSPSVVNRFFSLLSCKGVGTISKYEPVFSETLYRIIASDYHEQGRTGKIGAKTHSFTLDVFGALKNGFGLHLWIYAHKLSADPMCICGVVVNDYEVRVMAQGNKILLDIHREIIDTDIELSIDGWCFLNIVFHGSMVVYSRDLQSERMHQLEGSPFAGISKITWLGQESVSRLDFDGELGFVGLSDLSNPSVSSRAYLGSPVSGPTDKRGFLFGFYEGLWPQSSHEDTDHKSFAFCLSRLLRLDLLIPMFGLYSMKLEDGTVWEHSITTTLAILAKALKCPDEKTEDMFAHASHIEAICGILSYCPKGVLSYEIYTCIYCFFQNMKSKELRKKVFGILLVNPTLWASVSDSDHKKIFTHWAKVLFASDITDCIGDCPFQQMLTLLLRSYVGPLSEIDTDPNTRAMTLDSIHAILLAAAKRSFKLDDFYALCEWCTTESQRPWISEMLVFLLKAIVHDVNHAFREMCFGPKEAALLTILFNQRNETIIADVIDIIVYLHRSGVLKPEQLSYHLVLILKALNIQVLGETYFKALLNAMKIGNSELIPMCCWYAVNRGDDVKEDVANALQCLDKEDVTQNRVWFLWPAILAIYSDGSIQDTVLDFMYGCNRQNWSTVFDALKIISEALGQDWLEIQNRFLMRICEHIFQDNVSNEALQKFYTIAIWYLFMKPYSMTHFLEKLYRESVYATDCLPETEEPVESWTPANAGHVYELLLRTSQKKAKYWTFGIEWAEEGGWIREPLGQNLLRLAHRHPGLFAIEPLLLICHFVSEVPIFVGDLVNTWKRDKEVKNWAEVVLKRENAEQQMTAFIEKAIESIRHGQTSTAQELCGEIHSYLNEINTVSRRFVLDTAGLNCDPIADEPITEKCRNEWRNLWAQLSVENGPWYPKQSGGTVVTFKRDRSVCTRSLCPFKMCRRYIRRETTEPVQEGESACVASMIFDNTGANTRKQKAESKSEKHVLTYKCQLIRMLSGEDYTCRLYKTEIVLQRESDRRETRIANDQVTHVFSRNHLHRNTAIEIFLDDGRSYLLNFTGPKDASAVAAKISPSRSRGSPSKFAPWPQYVPYADAQKDWINRRISNFEYLMKLNLLSGRSFSNLSQYPIFPWILADYDSETLDLDKRETFRPLEKPLIAIKPETLSKLLDQVDEGRPNLFPSGPVSPLCVCLYLARLEPFTSEQMKLHGNRLDVFTRQMTSVGEMYHLMTEDRNEFWELIPEFFFMPEFLTNQNHVQIGVDNVKLPPWSRGVPINFIYLHRKALESEYVSANLNHWIDLIWGYKQRDREAELAHNTYDRILMETVWTENKPDKGIEAALKLLGQLPPQLFTNHEPHPQREKRTKPNTSHSWRRLSFAPEYTKALIDESTKLCVSLVSSSNELRHVKLDFNNLEGSLSVKAHKLAVDTKESHIIESSNFPETLVVMSQTHFSVVDVTNGNVRQSPDVENTITSFAASGPWVSLTCDDNVTHLFHTSRIKETRSTFKCYRDSVTCSCLSRDFNIHIAGTRDFALIVTSLKTGRTTQVIELDNAVPTRVIVTPSWGFIVVEVRERIQGLLKHSLLLYTINGTFVRKTVLEAGSIKHWTAWSSNNGFDYIAFITDNLSLFAMEVFYMTPTRLSMTPIHPPVGLSYSNRLSALIVIEKDGKLSVVDTSLSDFDRVNVTCY